jgi:hypothetical protein
VAEEDVPFFSLEMGVDELVVLYLLKLLYFWLHQRVCAIGVYTLGLNLGNLAFGLNPKIGLGLQDFSRQDIRDLLRKRIKDWVVAVRTGKFIG